MRRCSDCRTSDFDISYTYEELIDGSKGWVRTERCERCGNEWYEYDPDYDFRDEREDKDED